jgi:hypothetical protein
MPCLGILFVPVCIDRINRSRIGPLHSFRLDTRPPFLTDDLAVAKAREALAVDGYDLADWLPHEDRRTKAPDGSPDLYLARNGINPNSGYIMFVDGSKQARNPSRIVEVELKGDHIECHVVIPK